MPSYMALCSADNGAGSPHSAIHTHRPHRDCAKRTGPSTDNGHPHTIRCNGHSLALPKHQGIAGMDRCRSCIHAESCSRVCMARRAMLVAQQLRNCHRCSQSLRLPFVKVIEQLKWKQWILGTLGCIGVGELWNRVCSFQRAAFTFNTFSRCANVCRWNKLKHMFCVTAPWAQPVCTRVANSHIHT